MPTATLPDGSAPDLALVRRCYALADEAVARGNPPFGALLVGPGGAVLAEGRNEVGATGDVTRHAELALVAAAMPGIPEDARDGLVLYSSTEPCAMCAGALYHAGIAAVVYGCSIAALEAAAGDGLSIACRAVLASADRPVAVIGPVLEDEGRAQHAAFWSSR